MIDRDNRVHDIYSHLTTMVTSHTLKIHLDSERFCVAKVKNDITFLGFFQQKECYRGKTSYNK